MLSAKEARKIARSEVLQIMNLIREEAYRGGYYIRLEYAISNATIGVLEDYGYTVEYEEIPIYYESPYGIREDKPSGYKNRTTIYWK